MVHNARVKDKQGIPGDSQERVEVGGRAVGFFKSKDQMRPFLSCDWNRKSPAVHQKPEQGLKRQKKQRHSTYLKTVGWVCFEDLSTLPDGEITG